MPHKTYTLSILNGCDFKVNAIIHPSLPVRTFKRYPPFPWAGCIHKTRVNGLQKIFWKIFSYSLSPIDSIISLKLLRPDSMFSIISLARISGSGRLSKSVKLLSLIQKMSRLVLSLSNTSS